MNDSLQAQLAATRRNHILDAAAKVFAAKGFHPTTIKDIAREAGIADGTMYNYFGSKTDLLLGVFQRMRDSVQISIKPDQLREVDLRTFLHFFLSQPLMTLTTANFELFRVVVSEMMVNQELRSLYREHILEPTLLIGEQYLQLLAEHQQIKPLNSALTVRAISAMILGLLMQYGMDDQLLRQHWDDLPTMLTNLLLDGLGGSQ